MVSERRFVYSVDARDTLDSVNEDWLRFARDNGAPELTRERVLGRPLWDFIEGPETRELYAGLFEAVRRRGETFEIPFRCDSPDRFRFMQLALAPGREGGIVCRGLLVREQPRPFYSILDRAFPRAPDTLRLCSLCKRVLVHGSRWTELADAVRELGLFARDAAPDLEHGVCDRCRDAADPPEKQPGRNGSGHSARGP